MIMIDSKDILAGLVERSCKKGATACDAVLFETTDLGLSQRLGKPEGIERSESSAVGLRVFMGQSQATVSSTDTSQAALEELAERAIAMARLAPADPDSALAARELYATTIPSLDLLDDKEPSPGWLTEQCAGAEDAARSVKGITNSEGADASYSKSRVSLAISHGKALDFSASYEGSYFSISVSVLAGSGTGMERDYEFTSSRHRADLQDAASVGFSAAKRALARLNPRKATSARVPVVFDPRVSRGLVSTFASSISGSAVSRGASFLKDAMHTQIFAPHITIIDNPHLPRGMGSKPFDAEGVKNSKQALVENGMLQSWLLDVRSANKLKLQTTGHATRSISSPPAPASTNLYLAAGTPSPNELIGDIKSGLYLTETFGMGINTVTGDYSQGAAGFWIENGAITYPVSEITIAGNLREMFASITPANDLTFRYATNAPTVRIEQMTVAGT